MPREPDGRTGIERGHAALYDSVGIVGPEDRALFRLTGDRVLPLLNRLVTNDLQKLETGAACYAFLLTPRGRPLADPRILRFADEVWLDVPRAAVANVEGHFAKYLPPRFARVEPLDDLVRLGILGPAAGDTLRDAFPQGPPLPVELRSSLLTLSGAGEARLLRREAAEGPGFDLYVRERAVEEVRELLVRAAAGRGGARVGPEAYEIWRVERGLPAYGTDLTEENLPQETGQEARALSYDKGCYTGQEVVARIHFRGHVNRRLCGLRFDEEASPPGQALFDADREAGRVTSSVLSPRLGPIGLGYVRRQTPVGARLSVVPGAEGVCQVAAIPFT
ncbi:MAG: YgfZ/GcvT domain-containing protein [Gemmatimonadota bacterium]